LLATFVIFLREGIEASMIVAILLAYLDKSGRRRNFKDVFAGVAAALVVALAGGVGAFYLVRSYSGSRVQTIFEGATYLMAAALLTYMTFWMRTHARTISGELKARAALALSGRQRVGLAALAFQAVGREGVETAVFTLAIVFASASRAEGGFVSSPRAEIIGAGAGMAAALGVAFAMYRLGRKVDLGRFFRWLGALLLVFAAGLVADVVESLQSLGWVRLLDHPLWSTHGALAESSALGDVAHSLFGYADRPTGLQLICYGLYLVVVVGAFFLAGRKMFLGRGRSGARQRVARADRVSVADEADPVALPDPAALPAPAAGQLTPRA